MIPEGQYVAPKKYTKGPYSSITLPMRRKIQTLLQEKKSVKDICLELNIPRTTLYHERMRMGSLKEPYNADFANKDCEEKTKPRTMLTLPDSYKTNLLSAYELLEEVLRLKLCPKVRCDLEKCLWNLQECGARKRKVRKMTIEEINMVLRLWKEGKNKKQIAMELKRPSSTIDGTIEKHVHRLEEDATDDIITDELKRKWTS